jgi:hydrogenase maturation factor
MADDRRDVIVGPEIGEDAAAIKTPDGVLVVATDPITFASDRIGWYAVQINANDVAVMGATPKWFQTCILLPAESPISVERIASDISDACAKLDVAVIGGHTEVATGITDPIVVGTMMGAASEDSVIRTGGVKPGDRIIMTKTAGIEATSIIAREKGAHLVKQCSARMLAHARRFLFNPGISVVAEAMIAALHGATAMHDPTEGGVITGLWEMAEASGRRIVVEPKAIPVAKETARLCELTGLDPLRSIASGSLLAAIAKSQAGPLVEELNRNGVKATIVGHAERGTGELVTPDGKRLRPNAVDEIMKLFD